MELVSEKKKGNMLKDIIKYRELGMIGFIVILTIGIQIANPQFLTLGNLNNLFTNASILAILAIGMMLVLLTRGIDLSIGATLALSGMIAAQTVSAFPTLHPVFAILLGVVVGIVCGFILGVLVSKLGILPIIASLGLMYVLRGLTFWVSGGQWVSAHQMPESFKGIATSSFLGINTLIIIAIVVFLFFFYFMTYTVTGRKIYAVGSDPGSAKIRGINIDRILMLVYSIMGGLAGLSGVLWVSKYASAQGDTATGYEMSVIAACILGGVSIAGGVGKITGVFLGALLLGILSNALPLIHISPFWQSALEGTVILVAVIFNTVIRQRSERKELARRVI